ncbi:MAG: methionyl-tRNA formyltransferase [Bacteroidales bacterium]|nr:methionyl-tRNA formyltransferase [Candidatus Colimorpha onthohippi]
MNVVFFGTPEFAVKCLDAICKSQHHVAAVVTIPDKPTGRGQKMTRSAVGLYADGHQLPLLQPERLREPIFLKQLESLHADIFVVVAFRMLPQCVWDMPPLGTFNLHASLLPDYRGAAPINWAIINGDSTTGVTTFLLNEHIDEGKILLQKSTPIFATDNAGSLHDRLSDIGSQLVVKTLDDIANKNISPYNQPVGGAIRPAPKLFKADCTIPWHKDGESIQNLVRGLTPYPAATFQMTDELQVTHDFKLYATSFEKTNHQNAVGTILTDNKSYLKIAINDGFIHLLSLQISGKRQNNVEEFLRGHKITNWKLVTCK